MWLGAPYLSVNNIIPIKRERFQMALYVKQTVCLEHSETAY